MSITVDNVSYLTGMRQNMLISTTEKQKQKGTEAEIGKTQQSTVSASLDQVNMGQDGITVTEVIRQQRAEQYDAQKQPALPRMEAEGRPFLKKRLSQAQNVSMGLRSGEYGGRNRSLHPTFFQNSAGSPPIGMHL